ncbi:hypothetical protein [Winogradskyella sp. PC D3.3]
MKQFIVTLAFCYSLFSFSQGTQLLRQPTLHGNDVVFVYANDLWKASANGGTAIRLTSDDGYESSPHFSNDGTQIAFTAQYDGLERAIEEAMKLLKNNEFQLKPEPKAPIRWKRPKGYKSDN